ncbi:MAG: hypothetical protein QXL94_00995 [Candidatus Parvarchaeum sp.]
MKDPDNTQDIFDDLGRELFANLGKKLDKEFIKENKKLPKIADISVKVPEYMIYASEEGIDEDEVPDAIKEETNENEGEIYTLGDMRAWYKEREIYPIESILTFGHGKARVWGEGWSGGEYVTNVKNAAEDEFIKQLGKQRYKEYMDKLMEPLKETQPQISMVTKRTHVNVPLMQKVQQTIIPQSNAPLVENKIRETEEEVNHILEEPSKIKKKEERLKA